jgi:hypothetical protein
MARCFRKPSPSASNQSPWILCGIFLQHVKIHLVPAHVATPLPASLRQATTRTCQGKELGCPMDGVTKSIWNVDELRIVKVSAVEGMFRETWGKAWNGGGTSCLHDASAPLISPPGHQRRQHSPKDSSSAIHHPVCPLLPTPPSSKKMDIPWAKDVKVCSGSRHLATIVTQLYKFTTKANASS